MDSSLRMRKQVCELKKKSFRTIRNVCKIRFLLSQDQMKTVVNSLVVCCLDYCNALFYGINEKLMQQLQLLQKAASKLVMGQYKYDRMEKDLDNLHWLPIKKRVIFKIALLVFKSIHGLAPSYLQDLLHFAPTVSNNTRLYVPSSMVQDLFVQ